MNQLLADLAVDAARQSVALLFLAGIVPGLIIAGALSAYVMGRARRLNIPIGERPRLGAILQALRSAVWSLFAPVLILGGIYGGIFTPTEAAGIACIYALLVSVLKRRDGYDDARDEDQKAASPGDA